MADCKCGHFNCYSCAVQGNGYHKRVHEEQRQARMAKIVALESRLSHLNGLEAKCGSLGRMGCTLCQSGAREMYTIQKELDELRKLVEV